MNIFYIWIIGYIIAYVWIRILEGPGITWKPVKDRILISFLSWIIVFILIVLHIAYFIFDIIPSKFETTKPPKWL